jgi:hypothetical protein
MTTTDATNRNRNKPLLRASTIVEQISSMLHQMHIPHQVLSTTCIGYIVDVAWTQERVVLEVDNGKEPFVAQMKQRHLKKAGYRVVSIIASMYQGDYDSKRTYLLSQLQKT